MNDHFDDSLDPHLASEWSVAANGKDWTFKLREGIEFHNGDIVNAQDAVGSYKVRIQQTSGGRAGTDTQIFTSLSGDPSDVANKDGSENIEVLDDLTVTYHLNVPFITMDVTMSEGNGTFAFINYDLWQEVGEDGYRENPVGTGPFKFVELDINQFMLVERFKNKGDDHYWQIPDFDEVQMFFVGEGVTRMAMMITEEAHLGDVPSLLIPQAVERGLKVVNSTLPGLQSFIHFGGLYYPGDPGYNEENPATIREVRAALNHAIDRETLLETFFPGGQAVMGSVSHFSPFQPHFKHEEWAPYAYDPALARQFLAEAGFADGLGMELITGPNISGADWYPDLAEAMVPMWTAIGIDVQLTIMPYGNLLSEIRNLETSDFGTEQRVRAYGYRYGTRPDMGLLFNGINRYLPAGGGLTLYSDPFLWDWLQTWQNSIDPVERTIMEQGYGDYAYDNYTHIPLFWVNPQAVINPKVVVDYVANHKNFGPVRRLEFTEGVRE